MVDQPPDRSAASPANPTVDHEESDVPVRSLLIFIGVLLLAAVVIHVAVWFLMTSRQRYPSAEDDGRTWIVVHDLPPPSAQFEELTGQPGAEPLLQASPELDMNALRAAEDDTLRSWGWRENDDGVLTLPVDEALRLLAADNVPVDRQR